MPAAWIRKRAVSRLLCVVLIVACPVLHARGQTLEYKVKAAYLYHFIKFTFWPEHSFANEHAPLLVCILGDDPFGRTLVPLENRVINGHRPKLLYFDKPDARLDDCNLVFITENDPAKNTAILHAVSRHGVLTVSEAEHFADNGGMIGFVIRDQHVTALFNEAAAQAAGLGFDPRLVKLGKFIHSTNKPH